MNFAVTGSEANEIAMRMALAYTGKFDIVSMIRGLHGGSLAVEALTSVGGNRRKGLGPLMFPAKSNALLPPYCYRCPVNLTYPGCDIACLKSSEEMLEFVTSQDIAGIMVETIPVPGGMIVPPQGVAAAACRHGQALGRAADPRRMPAGAGAHRQDVGDGALRRDARHRHLGQGPVGRPRHLRHHHDAGDRRADARQLPACHGRAPTRAIRWSRPSP